MTMNPSVPTISLCMIVKNEEHYLEDCLTSVRPHVDEIIVVDTGSTDGTVEIARKGGARVFHFEWVNDFAAARNESLRHATGDWILQLDADERLDLASPAKGLGKTVSTPGVTAFAVPIRSHLLEQGKSTYSVNYNYRLFKRLPELRFEREVHESIELSLERTAAKIAYADFVIEHIGYNIDAEEMHKKLERNLEILERCIQNEPDNPYTLYYLANTYRVLGRFDEAYKTFERSLQCKKPNATLLAMIYNAMNLINFGHNDYELTIKIANQSLEAVQIQNTARYFLGASYYNMKEYEKAIPHLLSCYKYWRIPTEARASGISQEYTMSEQELLRSIAFCYYSMNNYVQAIIYGRKCLAKERNNIEVLQVLSDSHFQLNQYDLAIKYAEASIEAGLPEISIVHKLAYFHYRNNEYDTFQSKFLSIDEVDPTLIEQSMKLLAVLTDAPEDQALSPNIFEAKRALFARATFEQLARLVSSLGRKGHFETMGLVLDSLHQRTAELESLLSGIVDYTAKEGQLPQLCRTVEWLAARHPSHGVILNALGVIYIKLGDLSGAIDAFTLLRTLVPDNPAVSRTLAGLHVSMGNMEQALSIMTQHESRDRVSSATG